MKTTFYLDGKKTTRKQITELIGKERLDRYIKDAVETFREDPYIENSFWIGRGMLTIEFSA